MEDDIKKLLQKNYALTKETYHLVKEIRSYVRWQKFWGWVKFLVIVVPIILTLIYLPPLINDFMKQYQGLLGGNTSSLLKSGSSVDLNNLPPELQKYLK